MYFLLRHMIKTGTLDLTSPTGRRRFFGSGQPVVAVRFTTLPQYPSSILRPDLALLDAYHQGCLKIERGNLRDLQYLLFVNYEKARCQTLFRILDLWAGAPRQDSRRVRLAKRIYGFLHDADYRFSADTRSKWAAHLSTIYRGPKQTFRAHLSPKKLRFKFALFGKSRGKKENEVAFTLPALFPAAPANAFFTRRAPHAAPAHLRLSAKNLSWNSVFLNVSAPLADRFVRQEAI